jgi:flagellar operon protein
MIDNINSIPPIPVSRPVTPVTRTDSAAAAKSEKPEVGFGKIFEAQLQTPEPLRFSTHAQNRLQSRQISLNENQMDRLRQGVGQAEAKGSRDSLVLLDNLAFIVSVKNKTVVTALDNAGQSGHVFTKIDSTVFV